MNKLENLLALCACEVGITVNEHRNYYETAEVFLDERAGGECSPDIDPVVRKRMIETDTIVQVWFYPDTPIGSYSIYDSDLDVAVDRALEIAQKLRGQIGSKTEVL
jgi:hypothetical protein